MDFTALYVHVDSFWQHFREEFYAQLLAEGRWHRFREPSLSYSEMMCILIGYQSSGFKTFEHFYGYLLKNHRRDFPKLFSYNRFIQLMPRVTLPMLGYLMNCRGSLTGVSFIDSTAISVCGNKRISRHRVFKDLAAIGKTTMGWFYGFKLHLIVNDCGELLSFCLTKGNVDDREPVEFLTKDLAGKLFGDKGYISKTLFERLYHRGTELITGIRRKMKNTLMKMTDKLLLRKRSIIETINDQLKNVCQIEHSRQRSPQNFMVHLLAALIAYAKKEAKPAINWPHPQQNDRMPLIA